MLNEPEAARTAVKLHNEQFKSFKLSNVSTVSNILSFNSIEDEWFMAPDIYLESTESDQRLLENQRGSGSASSITLDVTYDDHVPAEYDAHNTIYFSNSVKE